LSIYETFRPDVLRPVVRERSLIARSGPWVGRAAVLTAVLWALACGPTASSPEDDTLIRVGTRKITSREFLQAFELTKTAYPDGIDAGSLHLSEARDRLLEELVVEMVLLARADALGVGVSDAELDAAVSRVRSDYPAGAFEQTLAESAVPFEAWRHRLRSRLVMDKLIEVELRPRTAIAPGEVATYYDRHYRGKAAETGSAEAFQHLQQTIVAELGRYQVEQAFGDWVAELKRTHPVDINHALWARITGTPPAGK
jgi:hypothetical protein